MDSVLEELKAVQHFVDCIQTRSKHFRAQDAHCLLIDKPELKTYLQSQWKLSELGDFFRKYGRYFTVNRDDTVVLKNPNLSVEELRSVYFFVNLLIKRQNRPIHTSVAMNFVNTSGVENFLRANYSINNLNPFFESHSQYFWVIINFISLKNYNGPVATGTTSAEATNVTPGTMNRKEKKYYSRLDKVAVNFYVDLIKDRLEINAKQAHSYLQEKVELRDFLREHWQLSNLGPFFETHPEIFSVKYGIVRLAPPPAPAPATNAWVHSNPARVDSPSVVSTSASQPNTGTNIRSTSAASKNTSAPSVLQSILKHETPASQPVVTQNTKPQEAKPCQVNQQDSSSQRNPNISTSSGSSTPVNRPKDEESKKGKTEHGNVSGNSNITNLLSLVMSYSPQIAEPRTHPNPVSTIKQQEKRQDAACQTLSTGPILSLSMMNDLKCD